MTDSDPTDVTADDEEPEGNEELRAEEPSSESRPAAETNQDDGTNAALDLDVEDAKPVTAAPAANISSADSAGDVKKKPLDLAAMGEKPAAAPPPPVQRESERLQVSQLDTAREGVRGDLARGLLWLLTLLIGGLLVFVGIGRVVPEVLTQSVFPSLVTLTGTALGFYFGSQSNKDSTK